MPNTLATPLWVLREVTRAYTNKVTFVKNVRRTLSKEYMQGGAKIGSTVQVRLPQRFTVNHGQGLVPQSLYDRTFPVTLNDQIQIGWTASSAEMTTDIQDVRERYTDKAAAHLANECDKAAFANLYYQVYNTVGTLGTVPTANLTYIQGGVKLSDNAADRDGRVAVLDTLQMGTLASNNFAQFNPQRVISDSFEEGVYAGPVLGIGKWYEDFNAATHTTGTFTASTPVINGANQTGSTLNINGWASGATTLKKGDKFTIAGVYGWNPLSQMSTGRLQDFVVTADTSDSAGTTATLPISPSIITSGQLQTVSNAPGNGNAVTVWSANPAGGTLSTTVARQGLIFLPDAFAWVSAELIKPQGGADSEMVSDDEFGVSIRLVRQYNVLTDQNVVRLDILKGEAAPRPEFACRVTS